MEEDDNLTDSSKKGKNDDVPGGTSAKLCEAKKEIEQFKESLSSKMAALASMRSAMKKRPKAEESSEDSSDEESAEPAKKSKRLSQADTQQPSEAIECVDLCESPVRNKGKKKKKKQKNKPNSVALPSFKPMSEVSFDSVVKVREPSLLETKFTEPLDSQPRHPAGPAPTANNRRQGVPAISPAQQHPQQGAARNDLSNKAMQILQETVKSKECESKKSGGRNPVIKVIFRDEEIARIFRTTVKESILEILASREPDEDTSDKSPSLELDIFEEDVPNDDETLFEVNGFSVDTAPQKTSFKRQLPKYKAVCASAMTHKSSESELEGEKPLGPGSKVATCFNCDGNHMISDCTAPKNEANIAKNRKLHAAQRKMQNNTSRYHVDEEQRFAHIKPGFLSENLRTALGYHQHQLPAFMYRLRVFGYPPGWLEDAKVTHSGISLIDSSCDDSKQASENTKRDTYDVNRIWDYPGFNVDHEHTIEEGHRYNCPPMDWNLHSKEAMIGSIGNRAAKGYKKKKLVNNRQKPDVIELNDDMEVVEINDEEMIVLDSTTENDTDARLQEEKDSPDSPTMESPESPPGTHNASQDSSDSLTILVDKRRELLLELEGSGSNNSKSHPESPKTPLQSSNSAPLLSTPEPSSKGKSKSLTIGTPIIGSASPFGALPTSNSFSQGISDHINFENLPDATGKYEKMKFIMNRIKNIADQTHDEDY